jgi:hypothetical protein
MARDTIKLNFLYEEDRSIIELTHRRDLVESIMLLTGCETKEAWDLMCLIEDNIKSITRDRTSH